MPRKRITEPAVSERVAGASSLAREQDADHRLQGGACRDGERTEQGSSLRCRAAARRWRADQGRPANTARSQAQSEHEQRGERDTGRRKEWSESPADGEMDRGIADRPIGSGRIRVREKASASAQYIESR